MVHDHSHKYQGHEHGQGNYNRAFAIGTALNAISLIKDSLRQFQLTCKL
ncbi:hypothetical protein [Nostoc sp.]